MLEGKHIKVWAEGDSLLLGDVERVRSFVTKVIAAVGMRQLGDVHAYDVPIQIEKLGAIPFEDEGGVTAVCVLSTSHCAIHTWPERRLLVFDLYSCRGFNHGDVIAIMERVFGLTALNLWDISHTLNTNQLNEPR
jgi:S-adenosylmethionine decarboxylase